MQMDTTMELKILLPFRVFCEIKNVTRVVVETSGGSYGLLPQRLDCAAALVPGILTYETNNTGTSYLAVDSGLMVKAGKQVLISVRHAIGGGDLGKLAEMVKNEFSALEEKEKTVRKMLLKLESGLLNSFERFRKS